jgi:plasmid stabilization system protein ParE
VEVIILTGAESDLWSAWARYEELSPWLGARFDQTVRAGLEHLAQFPTSAPVYAGEFRRLLLRRFEHGIFFRVHGSRLIVTAVLDLRQSPEVIRRRLGVSDG